MSEKSEKNPNIPDVVPKMDPNRDVQVKVMHGIHYLPAEDGVGVRALREGETFQTTWGKAQTLKKASPTGKYVIAVKK